MQRSLRTWQGLTLGSLFIGYMGYYVCRSVLPVASTQIINDPNLQFNDQDYGRLGAWGIYAYALGKLVNGVATEYLGGKLVFILGMLLSAAMVSIFASVPATGLPIAITFIVVWVLNRFVQSMGWGGLVQVASRWFAPATLATVMGFLSLSYLFGDAAARLYLGAFVATGTSWPTLFLIAAGTLVGIALLNLLVLRSRPGLLGLPEPPPPPENVHGADGGQGRLPLRQLLGPLFASRMFWLVCLMNAGLTSIRETFNFWTPRYLEKGLGFDPRFAGMLSFVFPFAGAIASLLAGWLADRLGRRFGRVMLPSMILCVGMLSLLLLIDLQGRPWLALSIIAAIALTVMGPYSFCSGVLAMNLGGQRAAAASAGIIDAAGYICGAIVSGEIAGYLVRYYGFAPLFEILAGIAITTVLVMIVYTLLEERNRRRL